MNEDAGVGGGLVLMRGTYVSLMRLQLFPLFVFGTSQRLFFVELLILGEDL